MHNYSEHLRRNLEASILEKEAFLKQGDGLKAFGQIADLIVESYKKGGRLYIAGNGGSAADAQHLATELVCKLGRPRGPLPAEALTVDSSAITAIGNDYGYEYIFSRQLEAKATPKDVFLAITTSGKSPNILKALEVCPEIGIPSVLLTGRDGGPAKKLASYCLIANGKHSSAIQELHITIYHSLCSVIENAIYPVNRALSDTEEEKSLPV